VWLITWTQQHSPRIDQEPGALQLEMASSFLFHLHAPQPPPKNMEKSQHHINSLNLARTVSAQELPADFFAVCPI